MNKKLFSMSLNLLTCLILVCALTANIASAQQVTASITGQVTDPSGAAMSGAKITYDRSTGERVQINQWADGTFGK